VRVESMTKRPTLRSVGCAVGARWRWVGWVAALLLLTLDATWRAPAPVVAAALWPTSGPDSPNPVAAATAGPRFALRRVGGGSIPMPADTPAAHASALLALPPTHAYALLAFWFAGTRESASDVGIVMAGFERSSLRWSEARWVVTRAALGRQLGFAVRRIGNPVAWRDAQGRVHLFVVATGLGGWAASRIVHLSERNVAQATVKPSLNAIEFDVVRVLPLSWLFNTSMLVRAAPLALADGGMVLPVYFELGYKYPVALRFDATGALLGWVRMSTRTHVLQPTLLALTARHWLALMRDQRADGHVTAVQTQDAGTHWQDVPDLGLTNPGASVAALASAPSVLWLAHNSEPGSRRVLDLSQSVDGTVWSLAQRLAQGVAGAATQEFSYPALAWSDGSLWVSYTDQRTHISWQRFDLDRAP